MAANFLVRRSIARLPCLVCCQVANITFVAKRPDCSRSPPPRPHSATFTWECQLPETAPLRHRLAASDPVVSMPLDKAISGFRGYCRKYNLLKGTQSIDEILDNDKEWQNFFLPDERLRAKAHFSCYWNTLLSFGRHMLIILFKEHLVKHCSHAKIQMNEAWKFKKAFSLPWISTLEPAAELYYLHPSHLRGEELPQDYKDDLLREIEKGKEQLKNGYRGRIMDEVMREIEEDIMEKINLEIMAKRGLDRSPRR